MKKVLFLLFFVLAILYCITAKAQQSIVYFSELDSKTQIGLGYAFDDHSRILSVMQKSKKPFTDFDISFEHSPLAINKDTVITIGNYVECDYILSNKEFMNLMALLTKEQKVSINGKQFDSAEVKQKLLDIEKEATKPAITYTPSMRTHRMIMVRPFSPRMPYNPIHH